MSWETFLWGENNGYEYRTFNKLRLGYNTVQAFRDAFWYINLILLLHSWYHHLQYTMLFMTQWGIHLTCIAQTLIHKSAEIQKKEPSEVSGSDFWIWRSAIIVYEVALIMECIIVLIYWPLLYKSRSWDIELVFTVLNHSVPLAMLILDFIFQKWRFRFTHLSIVLLVGIAYLYVNYAWTVNNWPVYSILTWDSSQSYILAFFIVLLGILLFSVWYMLSQLNKIPKLYVVRMYGYDTNLMNREIMA